ncbi:MAG: PrsW family intramembrane metalloprotease [bacterium]
MQQTIQLLALACLPCLAIIIYVWIKDKQEKEPFFLLLLCFILGILSIFPAIIMEIIGQKLGFHESKDLVGTAIYSFGIIAFSEEISKLFFIRTIAYPRKAFNEAFDGIMYSIMVGMGFAATENIFYVFSEKNHLTIGVLRMFTAIPMHATCAVIMGYFLGIAKMKGKHTFLLTLTGLLAAIFVHGLYDFLILQQQSVFLSLGSFLTLLIATILSIKAIHSHQKYPHQIPQKSESPNTQPSESSQ